MAVRIGKTQHPLALFCLNLFRTESAAAGVQSAKQSDITLADVAAMPIETQMLLAHCLEQKNQELTLLNNDTDVRLLLSASWLVTVPCTTIGIACFRFKPVVWRRLKSLCPTFLTYDCLSDLEAYRKRKSTLYPWNW